MLYQIFKLLGSIMILPMFILLSTNAQAVSLEDVESGLVEAEQLRASEFSPSHFADAKKTIEVAKSYLSIGREEKARGQIDRAAEYLDKTFAAIEKMNTTFSDLLESRDRMQMADPQHMRDDLVERAERDFRKVVKSVEDGNVEKAGREAKFAHDSIRAAQIVATREQFSKPISKLIAEARKVHARQFAPHVLDEAMEIQKKIEALIKDDLDAQVKMYNLMKVGEAKASRAINIARLGEQISKKPAHLEDIVDSEEARLNRIARSLDVDLSAAHGAEEMALTISREAKDWQQGYLAQIQNLKTRVGSMQGDLADMADVRHKLQVTRDAEAKIKRLTKLFNAKDVEVLLTPDADVILRMKALNFRSGSAVIPPQAYSILDGAGQAMSLFANRSLRIEGHTDSAGANDYNQKLSERRAMAVNEYLAEKLKGKRDIKVVGYGEEKPIANNETAMGREKNRRIDIVFLAPKS